MVEKKSWQEFSDSGLLWWINMLLHTFGWAIAVNVEGDGSISDVYPERVKFRGFNEKINDNGYRKVSKYLKENAEQLEAETED